MKFITDLSLISWQRPAAGSSGPPSGPGTPIPALGYAVDLRLFDEARLFADLAGTVPAATGGAVARVTGLGTPVVNAVQAVVAARPTRRTAGDLNWLELDGVDDRILIEPNAAWRNTGMSAVVVIRRTLAAPRSMLLGNASGNVMYAGGMDSGSSSTAVDNVSATNHYANGVLIPGTITRGALYSYWTTGNWVIAEVAGMDLTGSGLTGGLQLLGYDTNTSLLCPSDAAMILLIPTATMNTGTNRADLVAALAGKFGITL